MNKRKPVIAAILCLCVLVPAASYAGAGANMNACIYLPVAPITPMSVSFVAGGSIDHCMNNTGNNASLTVSTAGVSCASVGYVEGKSSSSGGDTCATDTSVWLLSYSILNTAYSGSTQSTWSHPFLSDNHIRLQASSNGTSVCSNSSLCTSTSQTWNSGTQGPLYIIFQPQAPTPQAEDEIKVDGPADTSRRARRQRAK
ncbi:MAG TPA: hypothetical protein VJA26_01800 [Gammaproteobacteria bacterium]|nr:hypothetical protein [Gammaproteobacteria bacterium]